MTEILQSISQRIESALDTIRPYLETDGGNVRVVSISEDLVVKIEFLGSCGSCPMSTMTFQAGIYESIKKLVPEVKDIQAINLTTS